MKKLTTGFLASLLLATSLPALAGPYGDRHERHFRQDRYERHFDRHPRHHQPRYRDYGPGWGALGLGLAVGGVMLAIETSRPPPVMVMPIAPPVVRSPEPIWYYCQSYQVYYPHVQQCPEAWRAVPAY